MMVFPVIISAVVVAARYPRTAAASANATDLDGRSYIETVHAASGGELHGSTGVKKPETKDVHCTAADAKNRSVHFQCDDGWHLHMTKCFFISTDEGSWHFAFNTCVSLNSTLAVIENDEEKAFALSKKGEYDRWIGPKIGPHGELTWPDGSTLNSWYVFNLCAPK
ncbi:early activation antigen CD69-like [Lissotriton helveticus]